MFGRLGVDAYAHQSTGIFGPSDFINWTGITDDYGNLLSLGNAWLTEAGAKKVMAAIGLSAPTENRMTTEGWNGEYKDGWVYGPRAARESRTEGPWRYKLPNWSRTWGNGWIWLDGYIDLLSQNKADIARYLFRNEDNASVQRALQYLIPSQYANAAQLETAINSLNSSSVGTGQQVNLGAGSGAQGTATGAGTGNGGNMSQETNGYEDASTSTPNGSGTVVTSDGPSGGENGGLVTTGFDLGSFFDKKVELFGTQIPVVLIGGAVVLGFFMMSGKGE